jgi:hypothetical protein
MWESFYRIFNYYFNIACQKVRRNICVPKFPRIHKDAVTAKTRLKELYNLYRQSGIQEHGDIYEAYKKECNYKNSKIKLLSEHYDQLK